MNITGYENNLESNIRSFRILAIIPEAIAKDIIIIKYFLRRLFRAELRFSIGLFNANI